jgi:F-type H+-transporting ATPase subunit gamma
MKAMAASEIGQYERSVHALADYYRTVALGLGVCFRELGPAALNEGYQGQVGRGAIGAVVFGSDQGLVGQFNELIADYALAAVADFPGRVQVWAVGERVHARLTDGGLVPTGQFNVPRSVDTIGPLIGEILLESTTVREQGELAELHLFHHRPAAGAAFMPTSQRLLPLDDKWRRDLAGLRWRSGCLPEVMGDVATALPALIREYLFISIFRACAQSLASENASRLASMERADRNISELLENLQDAFHRQRQDGIDEELFDVIAGYESLGGAPS